MSETKFYIGVSTKSAPSYICDLMADTGKFLYSRKYTLRTIGDTAGDKAFESGAEKKVELYSENKMTIVIPDKAFEIAAKIHPAWDKCSDEIKKYHAINVLIVYGKDLKTFAEFIICWTPHAQLFGAPGMITRIAKSLDIPVFNLARAHDRSKIIAKIKVKSYE
jgi:hypothetical protein